MGLLRAPGDRCLLDKDSPSSLIKYVSLEHLKVWHRPRTPWPSARRESHFTKKPHIPWACTRRPELTLRGDLSRQKEDWAHDHLTCWLRPSPAGALKSPVSSWWDCRTRAAPCVLREASAQGRRHRVTVANLEGPAGRSPPSCLLCTYIVGPTATLYLPTMQNLGQVTNASKPQFTHL